MRGRFAPTPSGMLHIGNAWSAVCAWLQTRALGGDFIIRIEDIDKPRCRDELVPEILDDLGWLGLDWEEGPDVGGAFGPYRQSERAACYAEALNQLKEQGLVYPCFCSRKDLAALARAPHGLAAEGPAYPGTCRMLSEAERVRKAARKTPSLRFKVPDAPICFRDLAAGSVTTGGADNGDFVVRRADGVVSYQLAVVADDAAMGITHVLRGADLLDSTPRQILLYRALGCSEPIFTHVPLILDRRGRRLAKRDVSITIRAMRHAGIAPEELLGLLAASAGWLEQPEPVSLKELMPLFDPESLPRDGMRLACIPSES